MLSRIHDMREKIGEFSYVKEVTIDIASIAKENGDGDEVRQFSMSIYCVSSYDRGEHNG